MASSDLQIYKCGVCGAEVEVIRGGGGTLVCCDEPMKLLAENITDAAQEKHVPVLEKVDGGVKVSVGSVPHPMGEDHADHHGLEDHHDLHHEVGHDDYNEEDHEDPGVL